jgi:hypothetical protein
MMTDNEELVERVARAIYAENPDIRMMNGIQSTLSWDETGSWNRLLHRKMARGAIEASGLEQLHNRVERLDLALGSLVSGDHHYDGDCIVIQCDSHSDAIARVRVARAALTGEHNG